MKKLLIISFLAIAALLDLSAQSRFINIAPPERSDFYPIISWLASPSLEGREAGSRGALDASAYIEGKMRAAGLKPFGDNGSWFQNFSALAFRNYRDSVIITGPMLKSQPDVAPGQADTLHYRNVLGIIPGKDQSAGIIIGAHYDHLGIRDGKIYCGADDNASGVAGMLSMAARWSKSGNKPPVNLIFAAWTAEEKGVIGSEYFVRYSGKMPEKLLMLINMDMISRSAPEDSLNNILSIGTRPESDNLRNIAVKANRMLPQPFSLDLWDVSGHWGSDYAWFSHSGIPVMTFFSGFSSDYHSPGDVTEKIDTGKMTNILRLVNKCLIEVSDSLERK